MPFRGFPVIASLGSGASGSSLLTDLQVSWKLSDLTDATGHGNTLTNNGSVTFNTGLIGNAAYFSSASSQYLSIASNAYVAIGDFDFSIGLWVWLDNLASSFVIMAQSDDVLGSSFIITWNTGSNSFSFFVFVGAAGQAISVTSPYGGSSDGRWINLIAYHNAATDKIGLLVDFPATAAGSEGDTGGALDTATGPVTIGARTFTGSHFYLDGRVDDANIWHKVLSGTEVIEFYNSGNGVEYPFS